MEHWGNMARYASPNGASSTEWPAHNKETDLTMMMNVPQRVEYGLHAKICNFWDSMQEKIEALP